MGAFARASVVMVSYPFSDLSSAKLRPAVVMAAAGLGDWVLCMVTSNPYSDPDAVPLKSDDFATGGLQRDSFVRPARLFTANEKIMAREVGTLGSKAFQKVRDAVVGVFA